VNASNQPNLSAAPNLRRILFVDDDLHFLNMIQRVIQLWGKDNLQILSAPSVEAALAILQEQPVDLVVLDVCMPGVNGLEFLGILNQQFPGVQKVVLTGHAAESHRTECLANGADLFLEKPRSSDGIEAIFASLDELTRRKPVWNRPEAMIPNPLQAPGAGMPGENLAPGAAPIETRPAIPIEINELLICSEAWEVYHAWQCANTDLRVGFLEFLAKKFRLLSDLLPLGIFDRAEFQDGPGRFIGQISQGHGVVLRTSPNGVAIAKDDTEICSLVSALSPERKRKAQRWFESHTNVPGLLAASLQFTDRTALCQTVSPQLPTEAVESVGWVVSEAFQIVGLQRFGANRCRWRSDQSVLECAQWSDRTILMLVLSRESLEANSALVEQGIEGFLAEDRSGVFFP
jgi:CheY-like chemotaxis protein